MASLANPVSVNAIYGEVKAQGFKISKDELYIWLQEACAIYLLCRVPKFSRSLAKQEAALAKYYMIDNGLRTAVIPMQSDDDGKQLIQVTWDMRDKETRKREIEGIIAASEALGCEDLVIVTHDESDEHLQDGHKIRIIPACSFLISESALSKLS